MKYVVAFIAAVFGLMTHPFVRWRFQIPLMVAIVLFLMEGCAADTHGMYATAHEVYRLTGFLGILTLAAFIVGRWGWGLTVLLITACIVGAA